MAVGKEGGQVNQENDDKNRWGRALTPRGTDTLIEPTWNRPLRGHHAVR